MKIVDEFAFDLKNFHYGELFCWPSVIENGFSHKNLELINIDDYVKFLNHRWKTLWFTKFIQRKLVGNSYVDTHLPNFSLFDTGGWFLDTRYLFHDGMGDQNHVFNPRDCLTISMLGEVEHQNFILSNYVDKFLLFNVYSSLLKRKFLIHVELVRQNHVFDPKVNNCEKTFKKEFGKTYCVYNL